MTQGSCWHLVQIRTSNRQVPEWNCTIATVSSQNHTPHNMITVHKNSCSKSAETPTFTTYIVQIPARSCGYFPKCTHACSLSACDDNPAAQDCQLYEHRLLIVFYPGIALCVPRFPAPRTDSCSTGSSRSENGSAPLQQHPVRTT